MASSRVTVVGIGADGWAGLTDAARSALRTAEVVIGGERQLDLLPASVEALREAWPSPLVPAIPGLLKKHRKRALVVLASGDPMFFGIGTTLVRAGAEIDVIPHPSSVSLAAARLGWALDDLDVVTTVGRPLELVHPFLQPGRRVLVLVSKPTDPDSLVSLLAERGFEHSAVTVLSQLGGPSEYVGAVNGLHDPLSIVAIHCATTAPVLSRSPGLPDDAYEHDRQITKREIRALVLAALQPVPGQLLWDVGAGSGSVAIEWMRTHPASRAYAIEARRDRAERIARNAINLGVPDLRIVNESAPGALSDLPRPNAIFVGGGVTVRGLLEDCLDALRPGGRVVANGVTLETGSLLGTWHARLGGSLVRLSVERAAPLGGFTGWTPARTVTQWSYRKEFE